MKKNYTISISFLFSFIVFMTFNNVDSISNTISDKNQPIPEMPPPPQNDNDKIIFDIVDVAVDVAPEHPGGIDDNTIFDIVDVAPEYPGGINALMQYLSSNIKYPPAAAEQNIEGRVIVRFVVDKTGKVREVKIMQSIHPLLDQEAVRVIKAMPSWIPGEKDGKAVNVYYTLPVRFALHSSPKQ